MFDSGRIQYITQAGVVFLVYLFVMIMVFYFVSPFVDAFFTSYGELDVGEATDEVQRFGPQLHLACKIILALGISIPIVWFIFWCLHREPAQYRRRYF